MAIDLTQVAFPDVIEQLDYEATLAATMEYFIEAWRVVRETHPELPPYDVQMLETDPVKIVLEVMAYREMLLRARVNKAARALMLATATGADLDNFAADFGMERLVVGYDDDGNPILEDDATFRQRRNLAPDGYAVAGPEDAYRYHAMTADGSIREVAAVKGDDNRCDIVLLCRDGDGTASQEVIDKVYAALSPRTRRPLTDNVYVRSAEIVSQPIVVNISVRTGPDPSLAAAQAKARIEAYVKGRMSIGSILRVDGIIGAAHGSNDLESVKVIEPTEDVDPGKYGSVYVPSVTVEVV